VDLNTGTLYVSGVDLCDGTPIIDIKPYHPQDRIPDARFPEWVQSSSNTPDENAKLQQAKAQKVQIEFSEEVMSQLQEWHGLSVFYTDSLDMLLKSVKEVLACEIRPPHIRKDVDRTKELFCLWFDVYNFSFTTTDLGDGQQRIDVVKVELWIEEKGR
jgi:hypothetical protein